MADTHRYDLVDVFSAEPGLGNPLAVIHRTQDLEPSRMARITRWMNLSETCFLLPPTDPLADYQVRIFSPGGELPFAGHPTLGSCAAWLAAGGRPKDERVVIQQCGIGRVMVRRQPGKRFAFRAPPLRREGPVDPALRERIVTALRCPPGSVKAVQWVDNGPPWIGVLLADARQVLALQPDLPALQGMPVGVVGAHPAGGECAFEVRGFTGSAVEDPVTGSLNAGLAVWLIGEGLAPDRYVAAQGTVMGRRGRVHVERECDAVWVGGDVTAVAEGRISL